MREKTDDMRIKEALELLNEMAKEKKAELQDMVSDKYRNLQSALGGAADGAQDGTRETSERGKEKVKDFASRADETMHRNPWPYLGGAALGFLILGYLLGRSRK